MPSTWTRGEPIVSHDPELNRTLRRMNIQNNPAYIDDEINRQPPSPVDAHNQVIVENPGEGAIRRQPCALRPQEYYRGTVNITDSDGTLSYLLYHIVIFLYSLVSKCRCSPLEDCFRGYHLMIHMLTSPN